MEFRGLGDGIRLLVNLLSLSEATGGRGIVNQLVINLTDPAITGLQNGEPDHEKLIEIAKNNAALVTKLHEEHKMNPDQIMRAIRLGVAKKQSITPKDAAELVGSNLMALAKYVNNRK